MKVTNNSKAPQGVHTVNGVVFLLPGQSRDLELTEPGHKQASRLDFLKVSGAAPKAEAGEDGREALFAKLKALGVEAGKNSSVKTLQEKLAEAEAKADAKAKEDIIAKLTEKGVAVGDDVTLEELQAELAKHQ
ncbi:hypothetical protein [Pseudomonas sp. p106]|uniref:hypothetical protein n=1 Tax=Pseudomonas sp. p106 TaxID=2479854 RepID=UPI000F784BF3|nr:hypothetical protein [Pseudomonas sp. p106]RRV49577.1 hypothetical protein EGJ09_01175 [Pseudomonas sp. p106]